MLYNTTNTSILFCLLLLTTACWFKQDFIQVNHNTVGMGMKSRGTNSIKRVYYVTQTSPIFTAIQTNKGLKRKKAIFLRPYFWDY